MANFRIPGPISGINSSFWFDYTVLAQWLSPVRGPVSVAPVPRQHFAGPDVSFIFGQCLNPALGLSEADYMEAASTLGVEVAAIKAVAEVETSGKAFDESGRPRILFERHYFHRLTGGRFSAGHPDISNRRPGGYGSFSSQYVKLERAYELDHDAALRSASWGRFQIMGDNYLAAGFNSIREFVLAMTRSESEHLKAFTKFVASNKKMLAALRRNDWAAFAALYNGPGYQKNHYDTKMKDAYNRCKGVSPAGKGAPAPIKTRLP